MQSEAMSASIERPKIVVLAENQKEVLLALVREAMAQDPGLNFLLRETEASLLSAKPAVMGPEDALPQVCTALQALTEAVEDAAPHIAKLEDETKGKMQLAGTLEAAASDARDVLDAWSQPVAPIPPAAPSTLNTAADYNNRRPRRL